MPTIKIPFSKGLTTSNTEGDWTDFLPVNMLAVPKMVLNAEGYMRNWPAITQAYDTTGLARGAVYNVVDDIVYRVAGEDLTDGEGNVLASIGANGGDYAPMSYSTNSTVIVSEGKLKYWADDGTGTKVITELQNWAEGERGTPVISDEWSIKYDPLLENYTEIPIWRPSNVSLGQGINANVRITDINSKQWIIGSRHSDSNESGLYVENGNFFITNGTTTDNIGLASIGDNQVTYSGSLIFGSEGIGAIGAIIVNDTPKEFLNGFITNLSLTDNSSSLSPREYGAIVTKTREEDGSLSAPDNTFLSDELVEPISKKTIGENTISLIGGSSGAPVLSEPIVSANTLTVGNFYLLKCSISSDGIGESGFSNSTGIGGVGRINGSGNVLSVYRCTISTQNVRLFSENSEATFTNFDVEEVTNGIFINFPTPAFSIFKQRTEVIEQPATDYDIGFVTDVTRNRARYIWVKRDSNTFGVTDLLNEQRPDYLAPFYSSELKAGNVVGVGNWRGYVVVFGRDITEYFNLTGTTDPVYVNVQSLTVRCGIAGVGGKCEFQDTFVLVGSPEFEPTSVFIINQGQYREIATRQIQKILRGYTEEELSEVYVEPVKFDAHDMVIIHLKRDVLVYDAGSSQESPRWSVLRSGLNVNDVYRGKFHINARNEWTVGDKRENIITQFDYTRSDHVGEPVEFVLSSQMVQARNNRIFDLEVDSISGRANLAYKLAVSTTFDGLTYGNEKWIDYDTPQNYTKRVLFRRLGYMRNNIGFKLRWITDTPTAISNLRVRVE